MSRLVGSEMCIRDSFKTYARDGVEASVKVKCFLGKPDAECTILVPALNDYLRETESCRRQVAQR